MSASPQSVGIKPTDLPAPPQAAMQIVRACAHKDVDHAELARLTSLDPVLTAELLRVVNSPFFGLGHHVQSIGRAINLLGERTLRNVVLCIAVRDAFGKQQLPGFNVAEFWEDAVRRGVAARLLAPQAGLDPEEAFTLGLLQDFGLLVLLHMYPAKAANWPRLRLAHSTARLALEQELFGTTHAAVGGQVAFDWGLPPSLTNAIANHHEPAAPAEQDSIVFQRIALAADQLACVFTATERTSAVRACRENLQASYDMSAAQLATLLAKMPGQVSEAARALGLRIDEQLPNDEIVREANVQLAEANRSYQELTWRLEATLRERDRLQAELNSEIALARDIQRSLLPREHDEAFPFNGVNYPARQLSGDFYDYFALPDGRIYFNLGDVSGKGINAALLMAKVSSLFRCLGKQIDDPAELLTTINNELEETSIRGLFVTMVAGIYDTRDGSVRLVNAGHMPALLLGRDGKFAKLEAQGPPLGIVRDAVAPVKHFSLAGRSLYLFSDGVTEGRVRGGGELGLKGLLQLLLQLEGKPPRQRLTFIIDGFVSHNPALRDDLTLLLLEDPNG
jgi:serine phosphatase RsbU (regulator of sigma subunit)